MLFKTWGDWYDFWWLRLPVLILYLAMVALLKVGIVDAAWRLDASTVVRCIFAEWVVGLVVLFQFWIFGLKDRFFHRWHRPDTA